MKTGILRNETFGSGEIVLRIEDERDRRSKHGRSLGRLLSRCLRARQGLFHKSIQGVSHKVRSAGRQ